MQGNGTAESPYLVATATDLDSIRNLPPDAHYRQIADINLGGTPWTPIMPGSYGFMGVYDGGGHKITGLNLLSTYYESEIGLFRVVLHNPAQTVEIKNLTVIGTMTAYSGGLLIGLVAGYSSSNTTWIKITNCHVVGKINNISSGTFGGLYGTNYGLGDQSLSITGCTAHVEISCVTGANVGGLIGNLSGATGGKVEVKDCAAYGKISFNPSALYGDVGGLIGYTLGNKCLISECEAHVDISGGYWAGGLVGAMRTASQIERCCATGSVSGNEYTGGLIGYHGGWGVEVRDCYATGDVSIAAGGSGYYFGGLCGFNSGTFVNCYASGNLNARNGVGGLCGYNNGNILSSYALSKAIVDNAPDYYPASRIASDQRGTISAYARSDMTYNGVVGGFPDFDPTLTGKDGQNITPEQAKMRATYAAAGWDMSVWDIVEGHTYPYLKSERNKIFVKQNGKICRVRIPYAKVGDPKPCQTYVKQDGKIYRV